MFSYRKRDVEKKAIECNFLANNTEKVHADELEVYGLISECWDNLLIKEESGASAIALGQCAASLNFEVHYWAGLPYPEWFGEILKKDLFSFEFKERSVLVLLQDIGSGLCLV